MVKRLLVAVVILIATTGGAHGDTFAVASDPWNPQDAIFAAARYLAAAGGQSDLRRAIFAYNHADWYVNEVVQLEQQFEPTASAQLPAEVQNTSIVPSAAGLTLAAASTAYQAALAKARVLAARADALERRAV